MSWFTCFYLRTWLFWGWSKQRSQNGQLSRELPFANAVSLTREFWPQCEALEISWPGIFRRADSCYVDWPRWTSSWASPRVVWRHADKKAPSPKRGIHKGNPTTKSLKGHFCYVLVTSRWSVFPSRLVGSPAGGRWIQVLRLHQHVTT